MLKRGMSIPLFRTNLICRVFGIICHEVLRRRHALPVSLVVWRPIVVRCCDAAHLLRLLLLLLLLLLFRCLDVVTPSAPNPPLHALPRSLRHPEQAVRPKQNRITSPFIFFRGVVISSSRFRRRKLHRNRRPNCSRL